jgi:hypothetical protein
MNYLNLLERKNYKSFTLKATESSIENGSNLLKKYSEISDSNLSESNRYVIYLEPGTYDLGTSSLILNKRFVDIIGLNEKSYSIITSNIGSQSNGTINQIIDDVNLVNLIVKNTNTTFSSPWHTLNLIPTDRAFYEARLNLLPSAYFQNIGVGQNFGKTYIENVSFIGATESIQSMRIGVSYNGTYKDVIADSYSFGFKGSANGKFIDCTARNFSFGAFGAETNGYFENCKAAYWSFGSESALVRGQFINCRANENSFGVNASSNEGKYIDCEIEEE